MRFDQPLSAFALESSGPAACALGGAHTLTLPAEAPANGLADLAGRLAMAAEAPAEGTVRVVSAQTFPPVTLTL
jgi:hypothetical protein